jgi:hypothetical protein
MILRSLSPILSVVVAVVLAVFFIKPTYDETLLIQKDIDSYRDAKMKYEEFTSNLQIKINEKEEHLGDAEKLNALVPEDIDETQILVDLKFIAKERGLLFGNIKVTEGEGDTPETLNESGNQIEDDVLIAKDISFGIIGTYSQFKDFLKDLERSQTLFEIIALSFDSSENSLFQQYTVTVRTYALPKNNLAL